MKAKINCDDFLKTYSIAILFVSEVVSSGKPKSTLTSSKVCD